jgi:hypothetical protein
MTSAMVACTFIQSITCQHEDQQRRSLVVARLWLALHAQRTTLRPNRPLQMHLQRTSTYSWLLSQQVDLHPTQHSCQPWRICSGAASWVSQVSCKQHKKPGRTCAWWPVEEHSLHRPPQRGAEGGRLRQRAQHLQPLQAWKSSQEQIAA